MLTIAPCGDGIVKDTVNLVEGCSHRPQMEGCLTGIVKRPSVQTAQNRNLAIRAPTMTTTRIAAMYRAHGASPRVFSPGTSMVKVVVFSP